MSDQTDDWTEEQQEYLDELYERYPEPYSEYRRLWYIEKMKPDRIDIDFIEQFLKWNSEYIPRREAILTQWPRRIPKGMVLELCHRAILENPDQLMCTPQTFFSWLKANDYLIKHKRYWHNDFSKD